ncbi:MAG: hypothetical protein ACXWVJ_06015 [Caulobacteraceae bacterium]
MTTTKGSTANDLILVTPTTTTIDGGLGRDTVRPDDKLVKRGHDKERCGAIGARALACPMAPMSFSAKSRR